MFYSGVRNITVRKPYVCDQCFQRPYKDTYITRPPDVCRMKENALESLDILVMVTSRPAHLHNRNVIRNTWMSLSNNNTHPNFRYVFLLGFTPSYREQHIIRLEQLRYSDIVQQNFPDDYKHLTMKTLMGLEWTVSYCNNARFILKVDEDVYVNIHKFVERTHEPNAHMFIHGECTEQPEKPNRKPHRKYYAPETEFADFAYPPHCKGPRYLLSRAAAHAILKVTEDTPFMHLEDVYIGMCLSKTHFGVRQIPELEPRKRPNLILHKCRDFHAITSLHKVSLWSLQQIWKKCKPGW